MTKTTTAGARWGWALGVAGLVAAAGGAALVAHGSGRGFPVGTELVYPTSTSPSTTG